MSISESVSSVIRNKKHKLASSISAVSLMVALSSILPGMSHAWRLGDEIPDLPAAQSTRGEIKLHELIEREQKYVVLFSHPQDFTPVCTTELAAVHNIKPELDKLGAIAIALSVDSLANHEEWMKDILAEAKSTDATLNFAVISDESLEIAKQLDMLPADALTATQRTPKDNKTARTVFIIDKDKKIQWMMTAPMTTGRDFEHILWTLKALKLTTEKQVATPANWKPGQEVIALPGKSDEEVSAMLKNVRTVDLPSGRNYLRFGTLPEDVKDEEVPLKDEDLEELQNQLMDEDRAEL